MGRLKQGDDAMILGRQVVVEFEKSEVYRLVVEDVMQG